MRALWRKSLLQLSLLFVAGALMWGCHQDAALPSGGNDAASEESREAAGLLAGIASKKPKERKGRNALLDQAGKITEGDLTAQAAQTDQAGQTDQTDQRDRTDQTDRTDRTDQTDQTDRTNRTDRTDRTDRRDRRDRTALADQTDHSDRKDLTYLTDQREQVEEAEQATKLAQKGQNERIGLTEEVEQIEQNGQVEQLKHLEKNDQKSRSRQNAQLEEDNRREQLEPFADARADAVDSATSRRLVTLGGTATELAYALGLGSSVVGVDDSSLWPIEAQKLPKVGYYRQFSVEGILSLAPEIVLASAEAGPPKALAQLEKAGIKVQLMPPAQSVEEARKRILDVAEGLGRVERAEALVSRLDQSLKQLSAHSGDGPKVLFFMSHGARGLMVAGENTQADAMLKLAGARNAVTGFRGYRELSPEAAILASPQLVLTTSSALKMAGGQKGLLAHPVLGRLEAVKQGRVLAMDDLFLLGFGPRLGDAAVELATKLREPIKL